MTTCATTWTIPLESKEWVGPLTVYLDGTLYPTGWTVAVVREGQRPSAFAAPEPDPDNPSQLGVRVGHGTAVGTLARGRYFIWIRVGDDTDFEEPVLTPAGVINIV